MEWPVRRFDLRLIFCGVRYVHVPVSDFNLLLSPIRQAWCPQGLLLQRRRSKQDAGCHCVRLHHSRVFDCVYNDANRYCLTQADTEAIAEYLMKSGISAKS
jgi:hypothetical protein